MGNAFYMLRAGFVRRGSERGLRSAVAAAAYRSGTRLFSEREDQAIDYSQRSGVLAEGVITPDQAPRWMQDREQLWNAIEGKSKRHDARLARDFTLALPHQFTEAQMQEALTGFLQRQFVARGLVADYAIHAPGKEGDERNFHCHVLVTERPVLEEGFSPKKDRSLNDRAALQNWRVAWADELNRIFTREQLRGENGELLKADHRSYKEQGIEREPGVHMGPAATRLERRFGVDTEVGDFNRAIAERNAEREELRHELHEIEAAIEREELAERRAEKIRNLLGDRADTTMTDEQVMDAAREKSIRDLLGEDAEPEKARAEEPPQPRLRPRSRDFDFGA